MFYHKASPNIKLINSFSENQNKAAGKINPIEIYLND